MLAQRMMWIVWPAFLVAGVLEVLVFAFVDPHDMQWLGQPIELSRQGVYTLSFFVFWTITAGSSALTVLLSKSAIDINRSPTTLSERPKLSRQQEVRVTPVAI